MQTLEQLKTTVEEILRRHGVRYTLEWYVSWEPFYTPPRLLCAAVGDAVAQVTGVRPETVHRRRHIRRTLYRAARAEVVELRRGERLDPQGQRVRTPRDIDALHRMYVNVLRRLLAEIRRHAQPTQDKRPDQHPCRHGEAEESPVDLAALPAPGEHLADDLPQRRVLQEPPRAARHRKAGEPGGRLCTYRCRAATASVASAATAISSA